MPNNFPILVQSGGTTPTSGDYLVRFIDFDGTILKEQWVDHGQAATAPTTPTHEYLTFDEWNNDFDNITHNLDVGATYYTTNGATYLFCTFTTITGLQPTLNIYKNEVGDMTVLWGDGETATISASGTTNLTKSNPYTTGGSYIISILYTSLHRGTLLGGSATVYKYALTKAYISSLFNSSNIAYISDYVNLEYVMIPALNTQLAASSLFSYANLKHLTIPRGQLIISGAILYYNKNLESVSFPNSVTNLTLTTGSFAYDINLSIFIFSENLTSVTNAAFQESGIRKADMRHTQLTILPVNMFRSAPLLEEAYIGHAVTQLAINTFLGCDNVKRYDFLPVIPPTIATTTFLYISALCKFYVPDASVTAYKTATNWVTYADYIYPISLLPEYDGTIFWQTNGADPIREWRGTPGTLAPLPIAPTKAGFTFAGWYKDEALTTAWDQNTDVCPTTNLTLYAKWI